MELISNDGPTSVRPETEAAGVELDRHCGENVAIMLHRAGMTQTELARAIASSQPTLSRKIQGKGVWLLRDIALIAPVLDVVPAELIGDLPTYQDWIARRENGDES